MSTKKIPVNWVFGALTTTTIVLLIIVILLAIKVKTIENPGQQEEVPTPVKYLPKEIKLQLAEVIQPLLVEIQPEEDIREQTVKDDLLKRITKDTGISPDDVELAFLIGKEWEVHGETLISLYGKETIYSNFMGKYTPKETMNTNDRRAFEEICRLTERNPDIEVCSAAGAIGLTQFMPSTWEIYGKDGDGDGVASPWVLADALTSSANLLRNHGYSESPWEATCYYNGGKNRGLSIKKYANVVIARAILWKEPRAFGPLYL